MKTILLVEDDELLGNLLRTKLVKEGYDAVLVKDGEKGIEALQDKTFDLILLDILMPRMNGREFLEHIRSEEKWKDIPVIVISNSGELFSDEEAKKFGVIDYLVKANFNPSEVIEKVEQQIGASVPHSVEKEKTETHGSQKDSVALTVNQPDGRTGTTGGKKNRLLVVEDDEFLRELITTKLINEGFEVIEAVDGEDGLRKTREGKPDLVLLDIILPNIDGFEVLKQLKADPSVASIPVVVLSNLGQQDDVERALSMGAKDYLIKAHFTPREIVEKVKLVLSRE